MADQKSGWFVRFGQAVRRAYQASRADEKSGFDYEQYRRTGTLALFWGLAIVVFAVVARSFTDWPEVPSWFFPAGLALIWIGIRVPPGLAHYLPAHGRPGGALAEAH